MKNILGKGKRPAAVLLVLLMVMSIVRPVGTAESATADITKPADGYYYITPDDREDLALSVDMTQSPAKFSIGKRGASGTQLVYVKSVGNGLYTLTIGAYALEETARGQYYGLKLSTPAGTNAQKWSFSNRGNGLVSVQSYGAKGQCIDIDGGAVAEGHGVSMWEYWGGDNQHFRLIPWEGMSVAGASLTVSEGALGMNLFLSGVAEQFAVRGYVDINGEAYPFGERQSDGMYRITCYVAPKDIGRELTISVYDGEKMVGFRNGVTDGGAFHYSVREYLTEIRKTDNHLGRLAAAIDVYGSCAADYFYMPAVPENVTVGEIVLEPYEKKLEGTLPKGVQYYGSSLVLNETIGIRHYFTYDGVTPVQAEVKFDGQPAELYSRDDLFYLEIPDIRSYDIDRSYTLTVTSPEQSYQLTYSVLSYAFDAASRKEDERLCRLVKSIYWYGQAMNKCVPGSNETDYLSYMNSSYAYDMPRAVLVVPSKASGEENYAATLLQRYIEREDGYQPAIVSDGTPLSGEQFEISVGATNRPHGTPKYTSEDSYSIKSYNNGVSITGVGKLGLMHGAMRFLEDCGGYFYMSWDDLLVTNQEHFRYDILNGISIDYERPFLYTDSDLCYPWLNPRADGTDPNRAMVGRPGYVPPYTGRLYTLAFGFNGTMADNYALPSGQPGRRSWYLSTREGAYEATGAQVGVAHTLMEEFIDADQYFSSHPEWFCAPNAYQSLGYGGYVSDDRKTRNKTQLCLYRATHDEELYQLLLKHCYDMIAAAYDPNEAMQIISLSKADNEFMCYCDLCVNHRKSFGEGNHSKEAYELLELLNKISADLHAGGRYDNLYIDSLSYVWTLKAPVGMKADDHVIIRWAPIARCYGHYLDCPGSDDQINAEYYPELVKWLDIAKHVWIWEYNINFRSTIGPYANVDVVQHDIKLYKKLGVEGIYMQSNDVHQRTNVEFGDIRNYIVGRMLQDPSRDYENELAFYTYAYYGASGAKVREYQKYMERQMAFHQMRYEERDKIANCFFYLYDTYADELDGSDRSHRMPDSEIAGAEECWQQIHTISKSSTEAERLRLQKLECSWRLVKSTLKVYEFADPATYRSMNDKLLSDIKATGADRYSIIGGYLLSQCKYTNQIPDLWIDGVR